MKITGLVTFTTNLPNLYQDLDLEVLHLPKSKLNTFYRVELSDGTSVYLSPTDVLKNNIFDIETLIAIQNRWDGFTELEQHDQCQGQLQSRMYKFMTTAMSKLQLAVHDALIQTYLDVIE